MIDTLAHTHTETRKRINDPIEILTDSERKDPFPPIIRPEDVHKWRKRKPEMLQNIADNTHTTKKETKQDEKQIIRKQLMTKQKKLLIIHISYKRFKIVKQHDKTPKTASLPKGQKPR